MSLLLDQYGYNDDSVDKHLLFSINQFDSIQAKVKAIDLYLKLKGRYPAEKHEVEGDITVNVINYGKPKK